MSLDTPSIRCPSPLYSAWTSQLFDRAFEVSFCLPLYWFSDFESIRGMCEAVAFRAIYQSSAHFTKAWVQGWQRTGECRHHCFHEAGSFHADNVDILSKVLWYCSHGKRFYVCFFYRDHLYDSSCEDRFSSCPPLSPLSRLPFAFSLTLYTFVQLGLFNQVSLTLLQLTLSAAFKVPEPLFLSFACFEVWNFTLNHFYTGLIMLLLGLYPSVSWFLFPFWHLEGTTDPWGKWGQILSEIIPFPFLLLSSQYLTLAQDSREHGTE